VPVRLFVDAEEDVAHLQPGFLGGRPGLHQRDPARPRVRIVAFDAQVAVVGIDLPATAEAAAPDFRLGEPVPGVAVGVHGDVDVGRDRSADAAVDADQLALHVEERAAGVAADQRAVGLDGVVVGPTHAADAEDRRAAGLEAAGVAGRQYPLAEFQRFGGTQLD